MHSWARRFVHVAHSSLRRQIEVMCRRKAVLQMADGVRSALAHARPAFADASAQVCAWNRTLLVPTVAIKLTCLGFAAGCFRPTTCIFICRIYAWGSDGVCKVISCPAICHVEGKQSDSTYSRSDSCAAVTLLMSMEVHAKNPGYMMTNVCMRGACPRPCAPHNVGVIMGL